MRLCRQLSSRGHCRSMNSSAGMQQQRQRYRGCQDNSSTVKVGCSYACASGSSGNCCSFDAQRQQTQNLMQVLLCPPRDSVQCCSSAVEGQRGFAEVTACLCLHAVQHTVYIVTILAVRIALHGCFSAPCRLQFRDSHRSECQQHMHLLPICDTTWCARCVFSASSASL